MARDVGEDVRPPQSTPVVWCEDCEAPAGLPECREHGHFMWNAVVMPAWSWRLRTDFDVVPKSVVSGRSDG